MFKINNISYDEQLLKLYALLPGNDQASGYVTLPSNKDVELVNLDCSDQATVDDDDIDNEII